LQALKQNLLEFGLIHVMISTARGLIQVTCLGGVLLSSSWDMCHIPSSYPDLSTKIKCANWWVINYHVTSSTLSIAISTNKVNMVLLLKENTSI